MPIAAKIESTNPAPIPHRRPMDSALRAPLPPHRLPESAPAPPDARPRRIEPTHAARLPRRLQFEPALGAPGPTPSLIESRPPLIGTPELLEIAATHSKQTTDVISNRNKNTTFASGIFVGRAFRPGSRRAPDPGPLPPEATHSMKRAAAFLIGTPIRLEIAVIHSKQTTEVISNRNKNATLAMIDRELGTPEADLGVQAGERHAPCASFHGEGGIRPTHNERPCRDFHIHEQLRRFRRHNDLVHCIALTGPQPVLPKSRILSRRINLDPVIPDPCLDLFSVQVGDDQVGILHRHVAIDAVLANLRTQLRKFAAVAILMTLQTFFRIRSCRAFGCMHVMARRTRHLRVLVAAASLRKRHLIAVHVNAGLRVGTRQSDVIFQLLSRDVRKRWRNRLPDAAMTLRAHLNLPVPRQTRRIHDGMSARRNRGGFQSLVLRMRSARPVASLTRDAQNKTRFFIFVFSFLRWNRLKVRGVTLQAQRNDGPVEVRDTLSVSRAIDPSFQVRPVRHRQLKKLIAFPIQIRLTLMSRPGDDVDSLRSRLLVRRLPENGGFVKPTLFRVHAETEIGIAGLQNVFAARKIAQDGILVGQLRCQVVRGARIRIADFLVALPASRVSHKVSASARSTFVRRMFLPRRDGKFQSAAAPQVSRVRR